MDSGGTAGGTGGTPINLFFMVDQSYANVLCADADAMVTPNDVRCMSGPNRWAVLSHAVIAFLQDPGAAGFYVALRFFPSDQPVAGCVAYSSSGVSGMAGASSGGTAGMVNCSADACSAPLIDLGRLTAEAAPTDTQEAALVAAVQAAGPPDLANPPPENPRSPTSAAMSGAAQWASVYQAAHPGERSAIVLVTQGEPQGCDVNPTNIAKTASDVYMTSAVRTFIVGLSDLNLNVVNQIAAAGGTEAALLLSDGGSFTEALLTQLSAM